MCDLHSTYTMIGVDMLSGPATKAEAALDRLEERALRLGKETPFSAQEAAKGMESLVDAGKSLAAAIKAAAEKTERGPRRKKRGRR